MEFRGGLETYLASGQSGFFFFILYVTLYHLSTLNCWMEGRGQTRDDGELATRLGSQCLSSFSLISAPACSLETKEVVKSLSIRSKARGKTEI